MLKRATIEDFDLVYDMAVKFSEEFSQYKEFVEPLFLETIIRDILMSPDELKVALLHGEMGMLLGEVSQFPYGPHLVAVERAWWVKPENRMTKVGLELLEAFEFWANKVGCKIITMSCLDEGVGKLYEKQGYKLSERAYMKVI